MHLGVHLILFTTGPGTPAEGTVPTIKISANRSLTERKSNRINFDVSSLSDGVPAEEARHSPEKLIIEVASGKATCNERNNCRENEIFKDSITA